ncbi:MAG TPA: hypothetical protein VGB17_05150 [Pyrinomonadaceae bacterium]|jgi:septal ring factor EnvC (AmiA/AmiB activator)
MKRLLHSHKIVIGLVLPLLLCAFATSAFGQCRNLQDCRALANLLLEQQRANTTTISELRAANADKDKVIAQLEAQVDDANKLASTQAALAESRQRQLDVQEEIKKSLRDNIALQTKMLENREEAIKDRDTVIKELVKVTKRSAVERFVDAIPSIAGIISLALVR